MPDKNIYPNVQFPDFGALLESVKENGRITRIYQEGESKKGTDAAGRCGTGELPFCFRRGAVRRGSNIKHQNSL